MRHGTRTHLSLIVLLSVGVACGTDPDRNAGVVEVPPTWVTEAEYGFGDSPDEGVFFTVQPTVRADPARSRVLAVLSESHQVGAWTLDGTLLFLVGGQGEGPGEFVDIGRMHV